MSTWDTMSSADYQACVDAGRVPACVQADTSPAEMADEDRKAAKESGRLAHQARRLAESTCPLCGGRVTLRRRYIARGYWQQRDECVTCGMVVGGEQIDHEDV